MKLEDALIATLKVLAKQGPMSTAYLGLAVFDIDPNKPGYRRGEGSHGTNKYCRMIGRVIKLGERRGLITMDIAESKHAIKWKATLKGMALIGKK